jgi:hypothetical protein
MQKKRKRYRPPTLTTQVAVRLNDADLKRLNLIAQLLGVTVTQALRECLHIGIDATLKEKE